MARNSMPPRYRGGHPALTGIAKDAQILAGRFVKITGNKTTGGTGGGYPIGYCGLGDRKRFGVSELDSADPANLSFPLASRDLAVPVSRPGGVARVTAGASLNAGDLVQSDANGKAIPQATVAAVAATLATGVVGSNNAITYTGRVGGAADNDLRVQLKDPSANSQSLSVAVNGNDIVVSLATDSGGVITSTATLIIAAIAASAAAHSLITAANTGASSGAGVVAAVALTALTGGVDAGTGWALGIACADAASGATAEIDVF